MQKILFLTVTFGLVFAILLAAPSVLAQETDELPDPGILPDSPVYFLDDLWKSVRIGFTFSSEGKSELRLRYAQEKLAEARVMADRANERALARALDRYNEHIAHIEAQYERMSEEQRDRVSERVAEATERHQLVLEDVRDRVPAEAQEAIDRAIEESSRGQITALRALTERRAERAADIATQALERQTERVRRMIEDAEEEVLVERRAALINALSEAGEEAMSRVEQEVERITEEQREMIRERLRESRERAETTLRETLERVPEEARIRLDVALDRLQRIDRPRPSEIIERDRQEQRDRTQEQFGRFIGTLTAPEVTIQMWGTHLLELADVRYHVRAASPAVEERLRTLTGNRVVIVGTLAWYDLEGGFWGLVAERVMETTEPTPMPMPTPQERPVPDADILPEDRPEGTVAPERPGIEEQIERFRRGVQETLR